LLIHSACVQGKQPRELSAQLCRLCQRHPAEDDIVATAGLNFAGQQKQQQAEGARRAPTQVTGKQIHGAGRAKNSYERSHRTVPELTENHFEKRLSTEFSFATLSIATQFVGLAKNSVVSRSMPARYPRSVGPPASRHARNPPAIDQTLS
jgi:hypothetical protein